MNDAMTGHAPVAAGVATAADNLYKLSRLRTVLERAGGAGIPVIVLKGAALIEWLYALHERPMADVDLLIHPADRDRFVEALAPEAVLHEHAHPGLVPNYDSGQFAVSFLGLGLDVHVHLLNRPWVRQLVRFDEEALWRRAIGATIAGYPALRLSAEDQLLHLAAHAAFHHADVNGADTRGVEDHRRLLETATIDFELLCQLAVSQGLGTVTWLALTKPILAPLVPDRVMQQLRPTPGAMRRIALATRLLKAGDRSLAPILFADHPAGLFRAALTIAAPSGEWLRRQYPRLPTTPLRRTWHVLRTCAHVIRRAARLVQYGIGPSGTEPSLGFWLTRWLVQRRVLRRGYSWALRVMPAAFWGGRELAVPTLVGPMRLPTWERSASDLLFLGEIPHEHNETNLVRQLAPSFRTAFDIGAHYGWYARLLGTNPVCKTFAIEADPETYAFLVANTARFPNISAHHFAAGAADGQAVLWRAEARDRSSLIVRSGRPVAVPMRTIDSLQREWGLQSIDFIKCDVEGGELEVLRGAHDVIAAPSPPIVMIEMVEHLMARAGTTSEEIVETLSHGCGSAALYGFGIDGELRLFDRGERLPSNVFWVPCSRRELFDMSARQPVVYRS